MSTTTVGSGRMGYRVDEVAHQLDVSRRAVYMLLEAGELPSFVVGRRSRRIPREAVEAFIARKTTTTWHRGGEGQEVRD